MASAGAAPSDEPVVVRQPRAIAGRRRLPTSDSSSTPYATPTSPAQMPASVSVPLASRATRDEDGNDAGDGSRQHPLAYLASSSPSRALSRFWDRLSPPVIPSPFHATSAPSYPPAFLANADLDNVAFSGDRVGNTPLPIPIAATSSSASQRPILEQHDSASQLSFSLRRAASPDAGSLPLPAHTGAHPPASSASASASAPRSASFGATLEGRRQARRPRTDSWDSPFRLPSMPWRGKDRHDTANSSAIADDYDDDFNNALLGIDEAMIDDEACFVDGWEGKVGTSESRGGGVRADDVLTPVPSLDPWHTVDFLVSLPSEISLNVLSLLDFRSVLSAGAVSRQWRCLTLDPLLWRDLFHQNSRWHIKPEAYRLAAEVAAQQAAEAAAAVAAAAAAAATPSKSSLFGGHSLTPSALTPPLGAASFLPDRPVMPNLKRAASSFGRTGVKRIVTGADRVSHGGVVIGRKLSEIVGDFNVLSLVPGATSQSRDSSRAPSEAGDSVNGGGGEEGPGGAVRAASSREVSQQSTPTRPPLLSRLSTANGTPTLSLSTAALPSTSTLQTNAFASPPSATIPRSYSSSALSTLSSAFPTAAAGTPARATRAAMSTTSPPVSATDGSVPPTPSTPAQVTAAIEAQDRRKGSEHLDWPKLFRDHWQLDQRWKRGKPSWSWFEGHEDSVYCCQFDERKIVSGSVSRSFCGAARARLLTMSNIRLSATARSASGTSPRARRLMSFAATKARYSACSMIPKSSSRGRPTPL